MVVRALHIGRQGFSYLKLLALYTVWIVVVREGRDFPRWHANDEPGGMVICARTWNNYLTLYTISLHVLSPKQQSWAHDYTAATT